MSKAEICVKCIQDLLQRRHGNHFLSYKNICHPLLNDVYFNNLCINGCHNTCALENWNNQDLKVLKKFVIDVQEEINRILELRTNCKHTRNGYSVNNIKYGNELNDLKTEVSKIGNKFDMFEKETNRLSEENNLLKKEIELLKNSLEQIRNASRSVDVTVKICKTNSKNEIDIEISPTAVNNERGTPDANSSDVTTKTNDECFMNNCKTELTFFNDVKSFDANETFPVTSDYRCRSSSFSKSAHDGKSVTTTLQLEVTEDGKISRYQCDDKPLKNSVHSKSAAKSSERYHKAPVFREYINCVSPREVKNITCLGSKRTKPKEKIGVVVNVSKLRNSEHARPPMKERGNNNIKSVPSGGGAPLTPTKLKDLKSFDTSIKLCGSNVNVIVPPLRCSKTPTFTSTVEMNCSRNNNVSVHTSPEIKMFLRDHKVRPVWCSDSEVQRIK